VGIGERKERERVERRALIIDCAKKLILENGVANVSMEDIAAGCELSKATLYLYFAGKDELFYEICEASSAAFSAYVTPRLEGSTTALESIKRYWISYLETFAKFDDMFLLFNMRQFLAPSPFMEIKKDAGTSAYVFYHLIKKMIEEGKSEGAFEADTNPDLVTKTIIALFSTSVETAAKLPRADRKSANVINELKTLFQIILKGIASEKTERSALILPDINMLNL
jgi:AcrR family transcriptional regulator